MIGLVQLENTTADCICMSIKVALCVWLSYLKNAGQAYDGASNFQGHVNSVAKRFLNDNTTEIPVHCLAHCVNLS